MCIDAKAGLGAPLGVTHVVARHPNLAAYLAFHLSAPSKPL